MVFRVFYPFMTFYNIYKGRCRVASETIAFDLHGCKYPDRGSAPDRDHSEDRKGNPRRGVIIQAIFRSNFVLFGLPLTIAVFGDSAASIAAMMVTVVVSIYNTTSVFHS